MSGLNQYNYLFRNYDTTTGRFPIMYPLAEKDYSASPYVYCANNPVRYIDPDGRDVKPADNEALKMIQNTLTTKDMKYVRFDANGNIDKDYLNSHISESGNYNALRELVNSDILTEVSLATHYTYVDRNGKQHPSVTMSYQKPDPELSDPTGSTLNGTTTGEGGLMGQTLLHGKGVYDVNSPDNTIRVIMNRKLSPAARAEMYSHEANGHALMYVRTRDRLQSGHIFSGSKDINKPLVDMIIKSKMETVKNMQESGK
ncbi:MAG: hypothetical protein FWF52_07335 [Candidatus Azobacteroides sp.]|nr:hypothetical protein [Candidatus Azobacteroides sp.]